MRHITTRVYQAFVHLLVRPIRQIALLCIVLGLTACRQEQTQSTRPQPLPQEELIQVYTNHEPASSYTEPYRQQTRPGDNLEQIIIDAIATAQTSVDVAVQELRLPGVATALLARHKAGVKVRVVLENTYARPFSSFTATDIAKLPERERNRHKEAFLLMDRDGNQQLSQTEINQRDALVMLDQGGIARIDDTADGSAGSNLMHHKFVVIDHRLVVITSSNFTTSDAHGDLKTLRSQGNANNLLKIDSPALATLFTQEFNLMWGDGPGGKPDSRFGIKKPFRAAQQLRIGNTRVEIQFSPTSPTLPWEQSSNGLIGKTLSQAHHSVNLALFVFSDQRLVNLLEPLSRNGVEIRTLIEPGFAYRSYSEALDMMGITLSDDCKSEVGNRPWRSPITTVGVPRLPPGDMLHHKFGLVDEEVVITGSHNWTDAANTGNDETLLVVHSAVVAAHFQREFERLYGDAVLGLPPAIRKRAIAQTKQCPSAALAAPAPVPSKQPVAITAPLPTVGKINLNTATQAELETLPGVGPGLAKRIIATRQQQPFTSIADLDRVAGVGPKLLTKLKGHITW